MRIGTIEYFHASYPVRYLFTFLKGIYEVYHFIATSAKSERYMELETNVQLHFHLHTWMVNACGTWCTEWDQQSYLICLFQRVLCYPLSIILITTENTCFSKYYTFHIIWKHCQMVFSFQPFSASTNILCTLHFSHWQYFKHCIL